MTEEYSLDNIIEAGNWSMSIQSSVAVCGPRLLQQLLSSTDKVLYKISIDGTLEKSFEELVQFLKSKGARELFISSKYSLTLVWPDSSYLDLIYAKKSKTISIGGYAVNKDVYDLRSVLKSEWISLSKKSLIYSIVRENNRLDIHNMGDGSSPLIKENYTPDVIENIEYVISSFSKENPVGRIAILNGPPGTGKTHLIRSILPKIDNIFLIIPSNLINELDKPEFLPLLIRLKNDYSKPIILVIEDGDTCLVPRGNDNISSVASLLNLSDGILGSLINIKMIISTNQSIKKMDDAILRPGRLCKNIYVGPLPYDLANKVYHRLMNDTSISLDSTQSFYTLAEIYAIINQKDMPEVSIPQPPKRKIGFFQSSEADDQTLMNKLK